MLTCIFGYVYPLNSFLSFSNWITAISKDEKNVLAGDTIHEVETGIGLGIARNTAMLEPFHVIRGSLMSISAYTAASIENSGSDYNFYDFSLRKYIPFSHKLTWANRMYLARTEGEDAEDLDLGVNTAFNSASLYGLRGYSSASFNGHNIASLSTEFRYMLFPRINGHIYFMWPDINVYSLSLNMFSDFGNAWNGDYEDYPEDLNEWGLSYGFGLNLNLYLLQLAPVYISVEFARPYDLLAWKTSWIFSSGFIRW